MSKKPFRTRIVACALLVLAVGFAGDAFLHTDDGCRVETHCLACRTAHVPVTTAVVLSGAAATLPPSAAPVLQSAALPRQADVAAPDTRGPPTLA